MALCNLEHIFLFVLSIFHCIQSQPRVTIENGVVVGKYITSHGGKQVQAFEGIPYAKPPIDDKRFKEPEPLGDTWIGEWIATEPGSPCMQYSQFDYTIDENGDRHFSVIGEEDCLFLNVYIPEGRKKNKAVLFIIHGGAFMFGQGDEYGPNYVVDIENVVIVTINYRLGPLGFLTTGDSVSPGNNGLKDQSMALKWVQKNIAAFGGDPNQVTILGLSAGGASVHYHYLSELSAGLFVRGYSFSGSALCPWSFVKNGVERTKQLAKFLGCPSSDTRLMVKCLRRRPARKIVEQVKYFQDWLYNPFTVFGPVVEVDSARPFLDDEPRNIIRQGRVQDLPWITSFTTEDGLYPAADFIDDDRLLMHLEDNWDSLAPILLFYDELSDSQQRISQAVKKHYFQDQAISKKTMKELLALMSDRLFIGPAMEAAALQAKVNTNPVYLYSYGYKGAVSTSQIFCCPNKTFGASHGDDMTLIIQLLHIDTHVNEKDNKMAEIMLENLEHYIRKGTPLPSLHWKPVSSQALPKVNYLNILSDTDIQMADDEVGNQKYLRKTLDGVTFQKDEL